MSTDPTHRRSVRVLHWRSNPDLAAVAAYAVVAAVVLVLGGGLPAAARIPIALPLLAFVPGYAAVAALLPASRTRARGGRGRGVDGIAAGLSLLERLTLSMVASVALVPIVALATNAVVGVTLVPVLAGVVALTLASAVVAARRRAAGGVSAADPSGAVSDAGGRGRDRDARGGGLRAAAPRDAVTLTAVAIAAVLLATSAAVAFSGSPSGGAATEFYLVDDTDDGKFAAGDDARTLRVGETRAFALGIEQHGDAPREYEMVARLEHVDRADGTARVLSSSELRRVATTVEPEEPNVTEYRVEPQRAGEDLRMTFLLYRGEAPDDPSPASAHRVLSLPIEVAPPAG